MSRETARDNWEKDGDDAKSAWLLRPGPHTWYNGADNGQVRKAEVIPSNGLLVRIEV